MRKIFPILSIACALLFSCGKNELVHPELNENETSSPLRTRTSVDVGQGDGNPYSLSVMQAVYDNNSLEAVELEPTDLYVRFLPQDSTQLNYLLYESNLELFDYPLDIDISDEESEDSESADSDYAWLYTTVKPDYVFPTDISYEILDECYIPQEGEGIVQTRGGVEVDVEAEAYRSLGYDFDDEDVPTRGSRVTPEGTIRVLQQGSTYVPVKGVKIRGHRFVKYSTTYTDANGNYALESKFRHRLHYAIVFDNIKDYDIWGNYAFFARANCNLGWHSKDGYSKDIDSDERAWRWAAINNAAYDYYSMCEQTGITKPPKNLKIWCWSNASSSSTPMLHRLEHGIGLNGNSGWVNFFTNLGYGLLASTIQQVAGLLMPDITIGTSGKSYRGIYEHVNHELAHASHFSEVGSDFWAKYVSYIMTYGAYGNGTGNNAELCGIGEMWGDYVGVIRRCEIIDKYIPPKYPDTNNNWFKPEAFWDLRNSDIHKEDIFSCLTNDVRTYDALYSKLCDKFPDKVDSLKACFNRYGIISSVDEPTDITFADRTITAQTTVTAENITVRNVSVVDEGSLTLVGNVTIYPSFLVEGGSSLEIQSH